ncbi:hypothetical protein HYFRA_00009492 [Hymenoscyphus fraxineus]|uniref:Uncharacterized protein n=1 Tax=Hymenoscyphus fraxineus TaxID=746836 RepID=A0A9N9PUE5_9HELO|nr:hypothetical protein HYFRA_00009492 [Hymenoscyphus fraxineus]
MYVAAFHVYQIVIANIRRGFSEELDEWLDSTPWSVHQGDGANYRFATVPSRPAVKASTRQDYSRPHMASPTSNSITTSFIHQTILFFAFTAAFKPQSESSRASTSSLIVTAGLV